ncbi:MAG: alpha-amylase family glycosyl hydrolase, partial [Spirochaetales bacterium]
QSDGVSNGISTLEEMLVLHLANENPAFKPFSYLFNDEKLVKNPHYQTSWDITQDFFQTQPLIGAKQNDLITMLREPMEASPHSLKGQLDYIRHNWADLLGERVLRLLSGIDMMSEEEKSHWSAPPPGGYPPPQAYSYDSLLQEYERFSPDSDWMPRVVLMAKTVLVWLDQLSKQYGREITRLDQIPNEELDDLANQGFTGLWLIGLWERSWASKRIKQINGNSEATSSAYSLYDYDIAQNLGGWDALADLRQRLWHRGVRLAADMVPNHTAMDSKWIAEKPHLFIQSQDCPFPGYSFNGENLSLDSNIGVFLEDRYYSKTDCAVVFKRVDNHTGDIRYIYHGNDGTGMPWNDTAQIDFLNAEAREEVIQKILHVARNFSIIRFDAAMVLAKKHIRRLWYPEPGRGGDIASRAEHAMSNEEFEAAIPNEFWREVVDRIASEISDTLLLAEAFWMMEGYFVRTLGMHRVYNSAFMNMLKKEENEKYRSTVKNTIEFDPQVLKRFVNFMNNPDEETAVAQFGKGDKYFGVCTLMVTMPGLPMFGHGQIEGFSEKYGMEYTKAYWNEQKDLELTERHHRDIFPLMKKRYLFSDVEQFRFYDVWTGDYVNENVFAYSNRYLTENTIVFYNNTYERTAGWVKTSCRYAVKNNEGSESLQTQDIGDALGLTNKDNYYVIFREQKTGLQYIRQSSKICDEGMYLQLNGFEYQVLLDIYEVKDDEHDMYRNLCAELQGCGVPDIEKARTEVFLKDLYTALTDFMTPELCGAVSNLCAPHLQPKNSAKEDDDKKPKKSLSLADTLKNSKQAGIEYFTMLKVFLRGNYGAEKILKDKKIGKVCDNEIIFANFEKRITKFVTLCEQAVSSKSKKNPFVVNLYKKMLGYPFMSEIITATCILFTVQDAIGDKATIGDAKKIIDLWYLDRKMGDILVEMQKSVPDMAGQFKRMLAMSVFCDDKIDLKTVQSLAFKNMQDFMTSEIAVSLLDTNIYNEILWFNREKAEESIFFAVMLYTLFKADSSNYDAIEKLWDILLTASEKSEYKVENFLKSLEPAKQTAGKKSTVKKT